MWRALPWRWDDLDRFFWGQVFRDPRFLWSYFKAKRRARRERKHV